MALAFRLPENAKIVELLNPAPDAAGRTGVWITCKYAHKVFIVCHLNQGGAAPVTLNLLQAKDVSGTGSKTGPVVPIWSNLDTSTGTGSDSLVAQTAASSYTTDAALKNKMVVFEVDPAYLDQANGFKDITIQTGASSASNITEAIAYVISDRYQSATPPTVITD